MDTIVQSVVHRALYGAVIFKLIDLERGQLNRSGLDLDTNV